MKIKSYFEPYTVTVQSRLLNHVLCNTLKCPAFFTVMAFESCVCKPCKLLDTLSRGLCVGWLTWVCCAGVYIGNIDIHIAGAKLHAASLNGKAADYAVLNRWRLIALGFLALAYGACKLFG